MASTSTTAAPRWLAAIVAGSLGLLCAYLLVVAVWLELDYFDSFHAFTNGRTIWQGGGFYNPNRSPGFPTLFAGLSALGARLPIELFAFRAAHVLNVGFFGLLLVVFFRLCRLHLPPALCWVATLALGFQGQLVHLAPMFKEDLFVTLLVTAAFFLYLRSDQPGARRTRDLVAAGVLLGLVGATKYNVLPLLLAVIALHELLVRRAELKRVPVLAGRVGVLLGLPLLVLLIVVVAVYLRAGRAPFGGAPGKYLSDVAEVIRTAQIEYKRDSAVLAYRFLLRTLTPPVLACAVAGIVVTWRRPGARFHLLWLAVIFLVHAHLVAHKEVRYLLPVLPPLCWFTAAGAGWLVERLGRVRPAAVGLALALAAWPTVDLLRECRRFADPVYTTPFERQVSEAAARLAGNHKIYWIGRYYPVHPRDHVFHPADITTSIYHFGAHVVDYYTDRRVENALTLGGPKTAANLLVLPQTYGVLADGDAFIFNPEWDEYQTSTMPPRLQPLTVMRLREHRLAAVVGPDGTRFGAAGPIIEIQGPTMRGQGLGAPWVAVRVEFAKGPPVGAVLTSADGSFSRPAPVPPPGDHFTGITLRWYEAPQQFSLPGQ